MPGNPLSDELLGEIQRGCEERQQPENINRYVSGETLMRGLNLDPQTVSALVTELIERRKAGTFAEGIVAALKVAAIHAETHAETMRGFTERRHKEFATEYRRKLEAVESVAAAIRSLTPNKDTTS